MRERRLMIIGSIIFVTVLAVAFYFVFDNFRLRRIVYRQEQLIKSAVNGDQNFLKAAQGYKDSIRTYTEKLSFVFDGTKISSDQFMAIYQSLSLEKDSLSREIAKYKYLYNKGKKLYGFDFKFVETDSTYSAEPIPYTRADSADLALKYFRKRIKRSSKGWIIDLTGPDEVRKYNESVRKRLNKVDKSLDSIRGKLPIDSATK